ncbi:MAG: hypothetical protein M1819_004930 [Sarea resinae]|nr:MAG: hypothetical protein M1819_004930 [Sarea resinae]
MASDTRGLPASSYNIRMPFFSSAPDAELSHSPVSISSDDSLTSRDFYEEPINRWRFPSLGRRNRRSTNPKYVQGQLRRRKSSRKRPRFEKTNPQGSDLKLDTNFLRRGPKPLALPGHFNQRIEPPATRSIPVTGTSSLPKLLPENSGSSPAYDSQEQHGKGFVTLADLKAVDGHQLQDVGSGQNIGSGERQLINDRNNAFHAAVSQAPEQTHLAASLAGEPPAYDEVSQHDRIHGIAARTRTVGSELFLPSEGTLQQNSRGDPNRLSVVPHHIDVLSPGDRDVSIILQVPPEELHENGGTPTTPSIILTPTGHRGRDRLQVDGRQRSSSVYSRTTQGWTRSFIAEPIPPVPSLPSAWASAENLAGEVKKDRQVSEDPNVSSLKTPDSASTERFSLGDRTPSPSKETKPYSRSGYWDKRIISSYARSSRFRSFFGLQKNESPSSDERGLGRYQPDIPPAILEDLPSKDEDSLNRAALKHDSCAYPEEKSSSHLVEDQGPLSDRHASNGAVKGMVIGGATGAVGGIAAERYLEEDNDPKDIPSSFTPIHYDPVAAPTNPFLSHSELQEMSARDNEGHLEPSTGVEHGVDGLADPSPVTAKWWSEAEGTKGPGHESYLVLSEASEPRAGKYSPVFASEEFNKFGDFAPAPRQHNPFDDRFEEPPAQSVRDTKEIRSPGEFGDAGIDQPHVKEAQEAASEPQSDDVEKDSTPYGLSEEKEQEPEAFGQPVEDRQLDTPIPPDPVVSAKEDSAISEKAVDSEASTEEKERDERQEAEGTGETGEEAAPAKRWRPSKRFLGLAVLGLGLLALVLIPLTLCFTLTGKSDSTPLQEQWVNDTSYPPLPTGISTIAKPNAEVDNGGCVNPESLWSCALPKELQRSVAPSAPNQPNLRMEIRYKNHTDISNSTSNSTTVSRLARRAVNNPVSAGHFVRHQMLKARTIFRSSSWVASPPVPSVAEQVFLGKTTDNTTSSLKEGEETPFYISFITLDGTASKLRRRDSNTSNIPGPETFDNGTASPANLLPSLNAQPLRLFDRGLETEHYGFYNYFDRSIFLSWAEFSANSTSLDVSSNGTEDQLNANGGAWEDSANVRCTWAQTRFLVQIWTNQISGSRTLLSRNNSSASSGNLTQDSADDFARPGSMPYPVTITLDRHGGNEKEKMVYCYGIEGTRARLMAGEKRIIPEDRAWSGVLIDPAKGQNGNVATGATGGIDGGTGGCMCQWKNFVGS